MQRSFKAKSVNIKKILIIQTAFPGDVILTTPLIQATHKAFPAAEIDFLTTPICENLIETDPELHRVIVFDKRGRQRGMRQLFQFARNLKQSGGYDLALVPHRSMRSGFVAWLARIPVRIGFDTSAASFLFTQTIKYRADLHEIDRNLQLLNDYLQVSAQLSPQIFPDAIDQSKIDEYFLANEISETHTLLAIAPGSVWATKKWPKENFVELCNRLAEMFPHPIFLIGGKEDAGLCRWIKQNASGKIFNTAGRFTFRESAALLARCQVLVCNDSAPLHLGVAVDTPVVAVFGPTVPEFGFYPRGEKHTIIQKSLSCRPCGIHGGHKCPTGTFLCMISIKPLDILPIIMQKITT